MKTDLVFLDASVYSEHEHDAMKIIQCSLFVDHVQSSDSKRETKIRKDTSTEKEQTTKKDHCGITMKFLVVSFRF